ncbi:MAG: exo-alpha-sialidase [Clostridia bacterium]|nr:exo-alpha-sialidase [Clostridia bacterium]
MMYHKLIAIVLCLLIFASWAFAAPEYGEHSTICVVDYTKRYWGTAFQYTRVIELAHSGEHNGTLIATYELATSGLHPQRPGYNIHISRDGGSTWEMIATVREKSYAIQSEWQPFLYELPCQIGDMQEGTLLLAACSVDASHSKKTVLTLYRSVDIGMTWEQYGSVAVGGGHDTAVWEPFLMVLPDGRLACYYSDSTECDDHSQKIVMKISEDGVNWGEPIDIVALDDRVLRPGMVTIAQMNDGRFIMTYEICSENDPDFGNAVHYRFSEDGIDWGNINDPGIKLVTDTGAVPGSAPYIACIPGYGENGLLLVTAVFQTPAQPKGNIVYINAEMGAEDAWQAWYLPEEYSGGIGGYSHAVIASADGQTAYFVNDIPDPDSPKGYDSEGYTKVIFVRYRFDEKLLNE